MPVTLTVRAADQVLRSATHTDLADLPLRIAARREADGSIAYAMGHDEAAAGDIRLRQHGVDIVVGAEHRELLDGAVLDFVELDDGRHEFIFMNPNDPHHVPPRKGGTTPTRP